MKPEKLTLLVVFGGLSSEHQISIITALQVLNALNRDKYHVIPLYIDQNQRLYTGKGLMQLANYETKQGFIAVDLQVRTRPRLVEIKYPHRVYHFDLALPVVHGQGVEDGALIGWLKINGIPCLNDSLAGAAVAQNKYLLKRLLKSQGINIIPDCLIKRQKWHEDDQKLLLKAERIGYPLVVKPVSLGSSIGVSKAENREQLVTAITNALRYEGQVIVEKMITPAQEINCAVLGDERGVTFSPLDDVTSALGVLTFADKYENASGSMEGQKRRIPAAVTPAVEKEIQHQAGLVFDLLQFAGLVRCDFLVTPSGSVYLLEVNTIPGSFSYYLFEHAGCYFDELLDHLIEIAKWQWAKEKIQIRNIGIALLKNAEKSTKLLF